MPDRLCERSAYSLHDTRAQPARRLARAGDEHDLVGGEGVESVTDRLHRVGVAEQSADVEAVASQAPDARAESVGRLRTGRVLVDVPLGEGAAVGGCDDERVEGSTVGEVADRCAE